MDDHEVGEHCAECQRKDFFAFQCPSCTLYFCADHRHVTCSNVISPEAPKLGAASTKFIQCTFYIDQVPCEREGVSKCAICENMYCLSHRFEDQHPCQGLQAIEEQKRQMEAPKLALIDKIRARAQKDGNGASVVKSTDEKQKKINKTLQRIKIKQTAKGDAKIPKDRRFVVFIELSETIKSEVTPLQLQSISSGTYFDKQMSIGQMLDSACKLIGIQQVSNFQDVSGTQIRAVLQVSVEPYLIPIEMGCKLEEVNQRYCSGYGKEDSFEQGDTLLLARVFEL
ncbi:hypothetical protein FGO68_gene10662 [Halteria grandinella]|uniref:AN1-type domain-containing protein n=1 Tax=Halteria grandinella TaxID=5974 RepID=A0A8J8NKK3_HALGN|nr:hypothetical protein FGO68_gene10662 [Halteria grandinella]